MITRPSIEKQSEHVMDSENLMRFECHHNLPCFTHCCQNVTIVLTPYDVLRLKRAFGISSGEFIDMHTIVIPKENRLIPLVILKMQPKDKKCPFVSADGCTIYQDRPWACRMYPLDMKEDGTFRFITEGSRCLGMQENVENRVGEWLVSQGVVPYDEMLNLFSEITAMLQSQNLDIDNPDVAKMVFMALYNLDSFKDFVFKSSFLNRFDVDELQIEKIKRDDVELMKFSFNWIKFGLFGQNLFKVKQNK